MSSPPDKTDSDVDVDDATTASDETPDQPLASDEPDPGRHPLVQDLVLNPSRWRIWPAVAVLRWLQRRMQSGTPRLVFRSRPSLSFAGSEVHDILFRPEHIDLVLNAPGLAAAGSALPTADIARIVADYLDGGALSAWLDGPGDRFMHLLEDAQLRNNPAYALMAGGQVDALSLASDLVGGSAPLTAGSGGKLEDPGGRQPEGAVGLAGGFLGPASASGLSALLQAFTGLPTQVDEFAGATITTARPAYIGGPFGRMLGTRCRLPTAGVEINLEGGDDPRTQAWAREALRRQSLHLLASQYVGAPSPEARLYLWLDVGNAPPAALDGNAALGGLAVLGESTERVRLPLAAGGTAPAST